MNTQQIIFDALKSEVADLYDALASVREERDRAEAALAEADAIIKEVGDLAPFYSANNMREAAITRTKRDFSQPDAPVETKCLEIRTIFAAQAWERKRNNG